MQNKFEDIIKQQVGEFQLTPNAAVWEGIEAKINKKKKRRIAFWLWSGLVGVSLLGIGYVGMNTKSDINSNNVKAKEIVKGNTNPSDSKKISNELSEKFRLSTQKETIEKALLSKKDLSVITNDKRINHHSKISITVKEKVGGNKQSLVLNKENKIDKEAIVDSVKKENITSSSSEEMTSESKTDSVSKKDTQQLVVLNNKQAEETISTKDTIKTEKKKVKIFFELGVGTFHTKATLNVNQNSTLDLSNATTSGSIASNNEEKLTANSKTGFAFNGGVLLQKQLSSKWQLLGGIRYVYYQDKQTIGNRYISTNYTDDGYIYSLGNKETKSNYTHSLQVPIRFNYLVGRYLKQDFHLAFGGNIGYQLKSDWLVNESNNNYLYYKNSLNRNLFGSFIIGINTTLKNDFIVSIEAEQAITKLQKNDKINGKYKALFLKVGIPLRK